MEYKSNMSCLDWFFHKGMLSIAKDVVGFGGKLM